MVGGEYIKFPRWWMGNLSSFPRWWMGNILNFPDGGCEIFKISQMVDSKYIYQVSQIVDENVSHFSDDECEIYQISRIVNVQ